MIRAYFIIVGLLAVTTIWLKQYGIYPKATAINGLILIGFLFVGVLYLNFPGMDWIRRCPLLKRNNPPEKPEK